MPRYQAIEVGRVNLTDEGPDKITSHRVHFTKDLWQFSCQQCEEMD